MQSTPEKCGEIGKTEEKDLPVETDCAAFQTPAISFLSRGLGLIFTAQTVFWISNIKGKHVLLDSIPNLSVGKI